MPLDWQKLRPWNASQRRAFELLCGQLASREPVPANSEFVPKGAPDAGVECFWRLPNGDEWGWQAKFFTSPPDKSQWSQLDESVKTALEKHPRLARYFVCLPIDRPDPRVEGQQWFMGKWNERVEKWQGWALERSVAVEFHYWGESEILERLSRQEHAGRYIFWFGEESLSQLWFERRIAEAKANAGPRYTPELHVDLPVADLFEALARTPEFLHNRLESFCSRVMRSWRQANTPGCKNAAGSPFGLLEETMGQLLATLEHMCNPGIAPLPLDAAYEMSGKAVDAVWQCKTALEAAAKADKERTENQKATISGYGSGRAEAFSTERHYLVQLARVLEELREYVSSAEAKLANVPALLLVGEAGTGKTHLLCDVANRRIHHGLPTVLLLGEHFNSTEPWAQIIQQLGLSCKNKEELLGALEACAQACGSRALILIDSLNEGEGKSLWRRHLAGMLTTMSAYPWVGLVVSVRSSYEPLVIPDGLVPEKLVRHVHRGFEDREYDALRTFFDYYHIQQPTVPFLLPEFQNPLFLKIFCSGLRNQGLTRLPSGLKGIAAIFRFFVDSINIKLSDPDYLHFDSKANLVREATQKLAERMAESGQRWLSRREAQEIVDNLLPGRRYEESLFKGILSEGLLAEDLFFEQGEEDPQHVIRFSYERLADHLIAHRLLERHLSDDDPAVSFVPGEPLCAFVKDQFEAWRHRGVVEAFAIQMPERVGKELTEVAPYCAEFDAVKEAFINSLLWRNPETIGEAAIEYINGHIVNSGHLHNRLLEALLTVAPRPDHPLNAHFLHTNLFRLSLAERDARWSVFLHYHYGQHTAVDRLIDWAWSEEDRTYIEDEAIYLTGVALCWFLTTSNRFLRDRATKALVALLEDRLNVLKRIIPHFLEVNDPYVLERLFAVAYGCVLRSEKDGEIAGLAEKAYEWIFREGSPPPHILLRDYARGVIETALHRGLNIDVDVTKVRPPYHSKWPSAIPSREALEARYYPTDISKERGYIDIWSSVMEFGDFARYIIGTNTPSFYWSSRLLGEERKPSRKELYEEFLGSLTPRQLRAWVRYKTVRDNIEIYRRSDEKRRAELFGRTFSEEELETAVREMEQGLRRTLGKRKVSALEGTVLPYLDNPTDEYQFDLALAQRWIFQRVVELGWTPELFGEFDHHRSYYAYSRDAHKAERIGKKYQWIAYHEFLARVADNFEFRKDPWSDEPGRHEGTWQLHVRDIDPSFCLRSTQQQRYGHELCWWFTVPYTAWESDGDDLTWLQKTADLPSIEPLLVVTRPQVLSNWLLLEGYFSWEQPTPLGEEPFGNVRRQIWYMVKSYIVKQKDLDEVFRWAKRQDFMGRWMPESRGFYHVLLGEYPWSPAFLCYDTPYYEHDGWTQGRDNVIPKPILVATDEYMWEAGYDCSIDETVAIHLPAKWLVDHMGLTWKGSEGSFFVREGERVALDPSVREKGPAALLANKDLLLGFLHENGYDILWTVLGEKLVLGSLSRDHWKGRLELSGVYRIVGKKLEGVITPRFKP